MTQMVETYWQITLSGYNWHEMESHGPVDQKVEYLNNYILTQLDYYLPTYSVVRHTADKPWVTDEFRQLIRRRQFAWMHGQLENYEKLRNMVNSRITRSYVIWPTRELREAT